MSIKLIVTYKKISKILEECTGLQQELIEEDIETVLNNIENKF